jgi:hypothetical protein
VRIAIVVFVALWSAGGAAASTVRLPSPTAPLDSRLPLGAAATATQVQLPPAARAANRQVVLVDLAETGAVTGVRVRQRLTLTGLGDYFFQIAAPVRDVRALPESQSEPGLRRAAVLWQGFSPGRRVLAAELELDPRAAARALPLRLQRHKGAITLRNVTAATPLGFVAKVQRSAVLPAFARIAEQAAGRRLADVPTVEVQGTTTGRRLRVDAPLLVRGTVGTRRFRLVLGGPRPAQATIEAPPGAEVTLTAEPIPLLSDLAPPARTATGRELLLRAERALFRLARVNQYRSFLASPAPGTAKAVYRFRTVAETTPPPARHRDDRNDLLLVLALGVGGILALGGAVVAWAHL